MKEYLEQRIAEIKNRNTFHWSERLIEAEIIQELIKALNHLNNIKE